MLMATADGEEVTDVPLDNSATSTPDEVLDVALSLDELSFA